MARACVIVLDAVGAGELPDAADYGDEGSNTLANVARAVGGAVVGGGGVVGVTVRNGSVGTGVGEGSGGRDGFSATGGCNGALGFFGCASA